MKYLFLFFLLAQLSVKSQSISLPKFLPEDKAYHIMAGFFISAPVSFFAEKPLIWGTGLSTMIGLAKEIYDSRQPNNKFDVLDLAATSVTGTLTAVAVHFIKKKDNKKRNLIVKLNGIEL